MKVLFSSNVSWSIYNFRLDLLKKLKSQGHQVHTMAARDDFSIKLKEEGFGYTDVNVSNNSRNPIKDILLVIKYIRLYRAISPDIILHNAIKPNIYGTIAAGVLRIPVINNISGLGTLFIKKSISTYIAKLLYWASQKFATTVFFQNPHDKLLFIQNGLVKESQATLIPGSGVDTSIFSPSRIPKVPSKNFRFLFIGRLLIDKGIIEYLTACKELKKKFPLVECYVLGPFYTANSTGITPEKLEEWTSDGSVTYLGVSNNVINELSKADCLVLPSYREGLSKVLLEASSMALPIVSTDVPGCRDVVIDAYNGFLCKDRDAKDLQLKMEKMLELSKEERQEMGENARQRVISEFDIEIVIDKYIFEIQKNIRNEK